MNAPQFVDAMVDCGFTAVDYGGKTGYYAILPPIECDGQLIATRTLLVKFGHIFDIHILEPEKLPVIVKTGFLSIGTGSDSEREELVKNLRIYLDRED